MARKPKKPTLQDLKEIEILAGLGLTQQQIADVKGICIDTLRKYSSEQLRKGKSKGIAQVAKTAFEMATSGKHVLMTQFFLRIQAGWREHTINPDELMALINLTGGNNDGD